MAKNVPVGYVDFVMNIKRDGDPDPFAVTFGANVASPPYTLTDLNAMATAALAELPAAMIDVDRISGITAYVANDGPPTILQVALDIEGTNVGNALPQNCAIIVSKNTGLGGRWNKGRLFWPSIIEAQVNENGALVSGYISNMDGYLNAFMGETINPSGDCNLSSWVVFHDETLELLPTPIIGLTTEPVIGTQRRRLRR